MVHRNRKQGSRTWSVISLLTLLALSLSLRVAAQDDDDPPGRAARLGNMEGSVSFQPAGESEWVEAVPNRPMTTGDKLWADHDSRADLELGSTSIHLNSNTGFSFLNLNDRTVQIQLSSGVINVRVRRLNDDDVFEVDTPNQAFSILQPGRYRFEASEDGTYTVVTVREGEGESTGNGQTYTVHSGLRATFSGTDRLNADFEQIGDPDAFDNWSYARDRHLDESPSGRYCSRDVVGFQDLDDNGDWHPNPEYGAVWYPHVEAGWAPYHTGHWAWIDPWGWTWVDDAPWGYAPFHYGRWAFISGRWGWVPGPVTVAPVYAPALVVFVGGGPGFGGNVAWFPLGPREVYVPSYHVSQAYVNRVNISNTTVNVTQVTNVYNTTIVKNTTVINNITYVNKGVSGAVTAVPQNTFASAQPVARAAVAVTPQQLASAQVSARVAVAPSKTAVLGAHAATANHVAAPPQAVLNRTVVAKAAPPPPPVPFAAKQQALAAHPGQPIARQEMQRLRPASAPAAQPLVKQAPPGKPATPSPAPNMARPAGQPGNPPANQPGSRPGNPPAATNERPGTNPPPAARPQPNTPPNQPSAPNRPTEPAMRNDRPPSVQPNNRPEPNPAQPAAPAPNNRPASNPPPQPNRPQPAEPNRPTPTAQQPVERNDRPPAAQPPANRPPQPSAPSQNQRPFEPPKREEPAPKPQNPPPAETRPPQQQQHPQPPPKPQKPEEKKQEEKPKPPQ
jgi:FecR protein